MDLQLSLFTTTQTESTAKKQKQAKLGRYEKLQRQLLNTQSDPYQVFIDIDNQPVSSFNYNFIDLFVVQGDLLKV